MENANQVSDKKLGPPEIMGAVTSVRMSLSQRGEGRGV
jgi:hypothetical protein